MNFAYDERERQLLLKLQLLLYAALYPLTHVHLSLGHSIPNRFPTGHKNDPHLIVHHAPLSH